VDDRHILAERRPVFDRRDAARRSPRTGCPAAPTTCVRPLSLADVEIGLRNNRNGLLQRSLADERVCVGRLRHFGEARRAFMRSLFVPQRDDRAPCAGQPGCSCMKFFDRQFFDQPPRKRVHHDERAAVPKEKVEFTVPRVFSRSAAPPQFGLCWKNRRRVGETQHEHSCIAGEALGIQKNSGAASRSLERTHRRRSHNRIIFRGQMIEHDPAYRDDAQSIARFERRFGDVCDHLPGNFGRSASAVERKNPASPHVRKFPMSAPTSVPRAAEKR